MTCVIPLLNNQTSYEELRYALRSIQPTRCILVGGKPKWYTGEHIPHKDYHPKLKELNIRDKVLTAASTLQGEFLFANDDHYLLKPIQAVYDKGLLSHTIRSRNPQSAYFKAIRNTMDLFGDVPDVDCHCPMIMEAGKIPAMDYPEWGLLFKTTYAQVNNVTSVYYPDMKLDNKLPDLSNRLFFSTRMYQKYLPKLFPNPSKFEYIY